MDDHFGLFCFESTEFCDLYLVWGFYVFYFFYFGLFCSFQVATPACRLLGRRWATLNGMDGSSCHDGNDGSPVDDAFLSFFVFSNTRRMHVASHQPQKEELADLASTDAARSVIRIRHGERYDDAIEHIRIAQVIVF